MQDAPTTNQEAAMTQSRSFTAVIAAAMFLLVPVGVAGPNAVAAEATHTGTFSTGVAGSAVIYSTAFSTPVLLTLCQTSAAVPTQVVVDGSTSFAVNGCRTVALTVAQSIQVSSSAASSGTYTISMDLAGAR
jgi:hypothetical protein